MMENMMTASQDKKGTEKLKVFLTPSAV